MAILINKGLPLLMYIIPVLMISCEKNNTNTVSSDPPIYSEIIKQDLLGISAESVINILGNPEVIRKNNACDVWSYGPSIDDMVNKSDGDIVGLTIYFDNDGKVASVQPKKKTNVKINEYKNQ